MTNDNDYDSIGAQALFSHEAAMALQASRPALQEVPLGSEHYAYTNSCLHGRHLAAATLDAAKELVEIDMRGHERPGTTSEWRYHEDHGYWMYSILKPDGMLREYATMRPVSKEVHDNWVKAAGREPSRTLS